ncbi:hypothetical protein QDY65_07240 [Pyrococcus kukulkanii]|uniref:hypothetical protein n=1 Tax=Pyrococcus kukulkanii TaxID=1609559 RepID=UPI0035646880
MKFYGNLKLKKQPRPIDYELKIYPREGLGVRICSKYPRLELIYKNSEIQWASDELLEIIKSKIEKDDICKDILNKLRVTIHTHPDPHISVTLKHPNDLAKCTKLILEALTDLIFTEIEKIDKVNEEIKDLAQPKQ